MRKYELDDYLNSLKKKYPKINTDDIEININNDPKATKVIFKCKNHGIST